MTAGGYLGSPWPAEDGGPQRRASAGPGRRLGLRDGARLRCTSRRTLLSTMTVLGAPGELYLLTHSALRAHLGLPTTACVERIDPLSLQTMQRSPRLAGGPMWPGSLAVHRNGSLLVVYGRHAHRLNRQCEPQAQARLPVDEAHNGFVLLDNGLLVTKNLSTRTPARLTVLDPLNLQAVGAGTLCAEPSVARLSAVGNTVYVVGLRTLCRYHWDDGAQQLRLDDGWQHHYAGPDGQTHGWDAVLDGRDAWFMDNGAHRYRWRMTGAGISRSANRLIRVSLADASDHQALAVSGLAGGSITNPPLVDRQRGIVVGFDSANRVLQAWRIEDDRRTLQPLWRRAPFGVASHLVLYPDSGELVVNDHRRFGEEVVVLCIETGREHGRVRTGGRMQGVVFPSIGWQQDLYWASMDRLSRVSVDADASEGAP